MPTLVVRSTAAGVGPAISLCCVAFVRYFLALAADRARMAANCPNCGADADTEPVVYYENIVQACANCGALR